MEGKPAPAHLGKRLGTEGLSFTQKGVHSDFYRKYFISQLKTVIQAAARKGRGEGRGNPLLGRGKGQSPAQCVVRGPYPPSNAWGQQADAG